MNCEEYTLNDLDELRQESERLNHCQDGHDSVYVAPGYENPFECYGQFRCACGCKQVVRCPGGQYCRARVMRLNGYAQTKAVREWMRRDLCICPFVIKNNNRFRVAFDRLDYIVAAGQMTHTKAIAKMNALGGHLVSNYEYTKASGNWSAARRRKLGRCPCGAFFCNDAARAAGLFSESEWKRMGYPHFRRNGDDVSRYYIDPNTAKRTSYYGWMRRLPDGKLVPYSHVRKGPQPVARAWRAFYEPKTRRWEQGVHSVDLFSADQMDLARFRLSNRQAIALMNGDKEVAKLLDQHRKPKRKRYKAYDPQEAAKQYEDETGFRRPH